MTGGNDANDTVTSGNDGAGGLTRGPCDQGDGAAQACLRGVHPQGAPGLPQEWGWQGYP